MPVQDSYYIKARASGGGGSVGAKIPKTGQTVSYATGDDGDLEAGRATDFFTLPSNNPHGNTNRFTDYLGGQSYSIGVLVDWSTYDGSTVLGYSGATGTNSTVTWSSALSLASSHSVSSFTSGWRLPNLNEAVNVCNFSLNPPLSYSIWFKSAFGGVWARSAMWTSTTSPRWSGGALRYRNDMGIFDFQGKTNLSAKDGFAVRDFTVTGTTLT
jgi:hypothetical protein